MTPFEARVRRHKSAVKGHVMSK